MANRAETVQEDEEDGSDLDGEEVLKPSKAELVAAFQTIRRGLKMIENVPHDVFHAFNECEHFYERDTEKKQSLARYS